MQWNRHCSRSSLERPQKSPQMPECHLISIQRIKGIVTDSVHLKQVNHLIPIQRIKGIDISLVPLNLKFAILKTYKTTMKCSIAKFVVQNLRIRISLKYMLKLCMMEKLFPNVQDFVSLSDMSLYELL